MAKQGDDEQKSDREAVTDRELGTIQITPASTRKRVAEDLALRFARN